MPVLNRLTDSLSRRLPKILDSDAHQAADYLMSGCFFASGAWFLLRKNRRAGLSALICGGSTLGLNLLTYYPGESRRPIPFELHGRIETGLAAMVATMPEFLRFEKDREKSFFLLAAGALTLISNLSSFRSQTRNRNARKAG